MQQCIKNLAVWEYLRIFERCAKVSAPLQLLHIGARITSADVSKRFRSRKNLQHICGLAKFHFLL